MEGIKRKKNKEKKIHCLILEITGAVQGLRENFLAAAFTGVTDRPDAPTPSQSPSPHTRKTCDLMVNKWDFTSNWIFFFFSIIRNALFYTHQNMRNSCTYLQGIETAPLQLEGVRAGTLGLFGHKIIAFKLKFHTSP